MKRFVAVLAALLIIISSVYAVQRVSVQSIVGSKAPGYVIQAGVEKGSWIASSDSEDSSTIPYDAVGSIGETDVEIWFRILQRGSVGELTNGAVLKTFAKSKETFNLDVTVGKLVQIETIAGEIVPESDAYMVDGAIISDSVEIQAVNDENKDADGNDMVVFEKTNDGSYSVGYSGVVFDDQPIAVFKAKWEKDISANEGLYQASITLTVSSD